MSEERASTAAEDQPPTERCWCCGDPIPAGRGVHLDNHPEVVVCIRCAHWLSKSAWELADRDKSSPAARARDGMRALRRTVVAHGWHERGPVGRGLRWLGRFVP